MTYMGYLINIRGYARFRDGIEAEITAKNGEHICITDSDRFSVEAVAREIVEYAHRRGIALDTASQYVLY